MSGCLLLDPRAGSGDLYPLLSNAAGAGAVLEHLDAGDVMGSGWGPAGPVLWGIEIKRLSDALQSLQDGRLPASQLPRMHDYYDYVFLLIEADMRVCPQTGNLQRRLRRESKPGSGKWGERWVDVIVGAQRRMQAIAFLEWLMSLHVTGGARLLFAATRETTAAWIVAVWRCLGKPWEAHRSLRVFDESHPPRFIKPSRAACVAKELADGIGWEKAMAAGEHFGSAEAEVMASVEEWMRVPGIGRELAERAYAGAREIHTTRTRKGGGSGTSIGAHGNVLPASGGGVASKRGADRGAVPRPKQNGNQHRSSGRGRRGGAADR